MALKILFYTINGVGLGHLSRQYAIAKKLRAYLNQEDILSDIRILTTSEADYLVQDFPVYKLPSTAFLNTQNTGRLKREFFKDGRHFVYQLVTRFEPDILVLDTKPEGAFYEMPFIAEYASMKVFIQRHVKPDPARLSKYLEHLKLYNLILIPDQITNDLEYPIPTDYEGERDFIGSVSLASSECMTRQDVCDYFDFRHDWPIIYVSAGGGGDAESRAYLDQLLLRLSQRKLYILAGYGPLHKGSMLYRSNLVPLREPHIQKFFTGIDYAISAAGYNSYQELLGAQVPTLFYHQKRGLDQQDRRLQLGYELCWHGILNGFQESDIEAGLQFLKQEGTRLKETLSKRPPAEGASIAALSMIKHWKNKHLLTD